MAIIKRARDPGRRLSYSQVSHPCGLQLKYHRERAPQGPRGIQLLFGSAVGAGIEHQVLHHQGADAAAYVAIRSLRDEVQLAEKPSETPIRWDEPPRITKKGEFHKRDQGRIPDLGTAERMASIAVRTWVSRFGDLSVIERGVERPLTIALRRPEGWSIECVPDLLPEDGGIVDIKTAATPWTPERLEEKSGQGLLYMAAYLQVFGHPPAYFRFHVIPKGGSEIQVLEVPYDAAAINRYLEHQIRPTIQAIEAGVYVPKPHGWHCSPRWCAWWTTCPLGEAAHPGPKGEEAAA
ncbi:MAG: PD-(D/E)XK nuclease family protein [Candidatus Dormibacteraceae bacterium]